MSDAAFGCVKERNAKSKFSSFRRREIDSERKSTLRHRETDGENTKSTHINKVDPPQLRDLQQTIP